MLYSIRSRISLTFFTATVIIIAIGSVSAYSRRQSILTTATFMDSILPTIGTAFQVNVTARDIEAETHMLSSVPDKERLNLVYHDIEADLNRLSNLASLLSRDSNRPGILDLNQITQAIQAQALLIFQLTHEALRLKSSHQELNSRSRQDLVGLVSIDPTLLPSPDQEKPVLNKAPQNDIFYLFSLLDRSYAISTTKSAEELQQQYQYHRPLLLRHFQSAIRDKSPRIEQAFGNIDALLAQRIREMQLRDTIETSSKDMSHLVIRLSEFSTNQMNFVFHTFDENAKHIITHQKTALKAILAATIVAFVIFFLLYRNIITRSLGERLSAISRAMGQLPADKSDTAVPVSGKDEIAAMARSLEGLLEKALQLNQLATMDELTKVHNRRSFFTFADQEVKRAQRSGAPTAVVMMLDIDHFKSINDTFGHDIGDKVLYETAQVCLRLIRSVDLFARIGGEEFALLMPETGINPGKTVAERILKAVSAQSIKDNTGRDVSVTLSIGLAAADLRDTPIATALNYADAALYRAKDSGRNRVVSFEEG